MTVQLFRKYRPEMTVGYLMCEGKVISKTIEQIRMFPTPCIKEGKYELLLKHNERRGWFLQLRNEGPDKYIISPLQKGKFIPLLGIAPVLHWDRKAKFSRLATFKVLEAFEKVFASGDRLWLEITEGDQDFLEDD
ncbi:hypothetical protein Belba_0970 [Belliella baltica DSM 15883]|uniref:DUF5675 domain-containing protein n=1 Tax=Belliella baltica (strain DSM 15883 / CIP 108006 / LMG 21964 / BA134) TaxID=866536 RepID=I3Z2Z5_BELBD|nr:DUF5675 family protein [Belliella baltica]AFL83613.1 hypothetical protein Belba_0970 [Belliella baltica DSM 15883]